MSTYFEYVGDYFYAHVYDKPIIFLHFLGMYVSADQNNHTDHVPPQLMHGSEYPPILSQMVRAFAINCVNNT